MRIYVIDIPNNLVTYFNVSSPGNAHKESIEDFYRHFPSSEQKKVMNWINTLADNGTDASDFLETDVNDPADKKQYFSMLQAESVDTKRKILHVQSYLFKYMASSKVSGSGVNRHGLSTIKEYSKAVDQKGKKKGVTIVYRSIRKPRRRTAKSTPSSSLS